MNARLPQQVQRLSARVRIAAAIEAMCEADRIVLTLRVLEGLSELETAGVLKIDVREVAMRTNAAMEALRQDLGLRAPLRRAA